MKKVNEVNIVKDAENEIPTEILEQSIVDIAKGIRKLSESRLRTDVLEHLISWKAGVSVGAVRDVLSCLGDLENKLLKKK